MRLTQSKKIHMKKWGGYSLPLIYLVKTIDHEMIN